MDSTVTLSRADQAGDTVRIERGGDIAVVPSMFVSPVLIFTGAGDDRIEIGRAGQPGNSAQFFGGLIFDGAIGVDVLDAGILSDPNGNGNLFARPPVLRGVENRLS